MSKKLKVFVSSRMQELADERQVLAQLLPQLSDDSFQVETWVFEDDALASAQSIRQVYLDALDESALYLGIFWNGYGEYTVDEFHRATQQGIPRLVFVKDVDAEQRDPRLGDFLERASDVRFGITPRWYRSVDEFAEQVRRAVRTWLQNQALAYHSSTNALRITLADDVPDLPRKLIGRKRLIKRVLGYLEDNERVLLQGFGGTGKTALAATIAADYIEDGLGTVIWIKAGTADADTIFEALGRAFDAQQAVLNAEGDAREQVVRRLLSENKGLLVLDDVWNATALATIAKVLPRRMPMLATSRQKYPLDAVVEIGELDPDEALRLLDHHARLDLVDDPDAAQLCTTLGNHAFALEVAGKTLKVYAIQPADLLARIEARPHDLDVPAGFGELGRTGIKSLLDVSIDQLDQQLYDIYVMLGGMFEPTASAELVGRTLDAEADTTAARLDDLVQRGLLVDHHSQSLRYYQLHDLAYSYARTIFTDKGLSNAPVVAACRDYALAHAADLPHLDIESSNILEAAETAYEYGDNATFLRIMMALTVDGPYFAARGHTLRTLDLLRQAIATAERDDQPQAAHYLWCKLGNAYAGLLGDFDAALNAYQHALALAQQISDPHRTALLLTVIGTVRFRQAADDFDAYHQQAEALAREHDDQPILARVLANRGGHALEKGKPTFAPQQGRDLSAEAAQIAAVHGPPSLHFSALLNQGSGEHELGDYEAALSTHQRALALAQAAQNLDWLADVCFSLGEDYHQLGDRAAATLKLNEALRHAKACGAPALIAQCTEFMHQYDYEINE